MSLLAFSLKKPEDGFPILEDWSQNAVDIFVAGYEPHRTAIEIRPQPGTTGGAALEPGSLWPNKGFGRVSSLWFGVLWTYCKLKDSMNEEQKRDFLRPLFLDLFWCPKRRV